MNFEMERVYRPRKQARKNYNSLSRWYDLFTSIEKRFTRIGIQMLDIQPGESVLEIGCGTGHAVVEFANKVKDGKVIAIDISEGMLIAAQKRVEKKGGKRGVELCQADGLSIPFSDEQFDAIFLSFTLELFDTPEIPHVLNECHRLLKPEGRIGVVALAKQISSGVRIYEWFHRLMPNLIDCRPIYVESVLDGAGFSIQKSKAGIMWGLPVKIVVAGK